MDKNLSWTSSLGDAYYNQEQDVMDAVQVMRQKAEDAGNLKSTPQQTVTTQDSTISIQPANPDTVYIPAYDPWLVYGGPIGPWPGWYPYPGIWFGGPYLSFGLGFGIGFYGGYGWGWGIGDSIGTTTTQSTTTAGTTLRVGRSITGTPTPAVAARAESTAPAAELTLATRGTGLPAGAWARAAEPPTAPVHRQGHSRETPGQPEDMLHLTVREV